MLPNRSIFKSRWKAMFWAACICFSALQFAGTSKKSESDEANTDAAFGDAVNAMNVR